jgi:hypothetical protein
MKGSVYERRDVVRTVAIFLAAALVVALVRPRVFELGRKVKETSDVYTLPPPRELVVLSLGYRSALADLLWAHVLVEQGLHTEQRRAFDNLIPLYDAINELEPTYRDPYLFADALITFQRKETPREEVVKAREIMERGTRARPLDGDIWLALGEFVAFIAPASYLTDPAEQAQWRLDGARMLSRAAELGGGNANITWQAVGGASLLSKAGERDAAIRFLRRTLAVTDDEGLKERVKAQLAVLLGEQRDDVFRRLEEGVVAVRRRELPHVSRMEYMVLGPPRDPALCAGAGYDGAASGPKPRASFVGARAQDPACAPTWKDWEERSEAQREGAP